MLRFDYETKEASRITIEMEGDVETYALNFLNIFNHMREYPSIFLKLENNSKNRVYVTCSKRHTEDVIEYLEYFGKVVKVERVRLYEVFVDYDYEDVDKVCDLDCVTYLIDEC